MFNSRYFETIKKLIFFIKLIYIPTVVIFISYLGWTNRDLINNIFTNINTLYLLGCISIWLFLHCLSPLFTAISFKQLGTLISYKDAFIIHTAYLPAKYLPGGIWHTVARSQCYCELNISKQKVFTYLLQENLIIASITLAIGGLTVGIYSDNLIISKLALGLALVSVIALILWPVINMKFFLKSSTTIYSFEYLFCIILMAAYWITASISFVIFLNISPSIDSLCHAIFTAGTYIFSWGIGFLALFAPQGFGVSESVAAGLLCTSVTPAALIVLLSSFRIIILIADLLAWLTSFYTKNYLQNN